MEWIEGQSLRSLLQTQGTLPLEQVYILFKEISEGLAYAHRQNVLHLDLKPENIMVSSSQTSAKIVDFGLAQVLGNQSQLQLSNRAGTFDYMAPEVYEQKIVGKASDVFSVAVMFYEVLTGEIPYATPKTLPPSCLALPETLKDFLLQSLQADPQKRFYTIDDFVQKLEGVLSPPSFTPKRLFMDTPDLLVDTLRPPQKNTGIGADLVVLFSFLMLILLVIGGVLFLAKKHSSPKSSSSFEEVSHVQEELTSLFRLSLKEFRLQVKQLKNAPSERQREMIPFILAELRNAEQEKRIRAILALGELGKTAELGLSSIIEALKDPSKGVQGKATEILLKLEAHSAEVYPSLLLALQNHHPQIRSSAALLLGQIRKSAEMSIPALQEKLKDNAPEVRAKAAEALGLFGASAKASISWLENCLQDSDTQVKENARWALEQIRK
jgi:hypothetical protein